MLCITSNCNHQLDMKLIQFTMLINLLLMPCWFPMSLLIFPTQFPWPKFQALQCNQFRELENMTVVNMESLISNFWLSIATKLGIKWKKKKPTISEHGVFSLTFYTCLIYICSTFQDGQKNCSHCVRVINDSLECKGKSQCVTPDHCCTMVHLEHSWRRNQ